MLVPVAGRCEPVLEVDQRLSYPSLAARNVHIAAQPTRQDKGSVGNNTKGLHVSLVKPAHSPSLMREGCQSKG